MSSGCLLLGYLGAREAAERQGDISDYPPKASIFGVSKKAPRISVKRGSGDRELAWHQQRVDVEAKNA